MILTELRAYLAERGPASITGLASRFEVEPDTMQGILEQLTRMGSVRRVASDYACGGCTKCDTAFQSLYQWADRRHPRTKDQ